MSEFVYQVDRVNDDLYFIGRINIQSVNELTKHIHSLEKERHNCTNKVVKLFISSSGGDTYQGLKLFDVLENTRLDILICFSAFVGSAATFLLGTKHTRIAYKNTIFGLHELTDNSNERYSNTVANMHCSNMLMDKIVAIHNTKSKLITKEWLVVDKYLDTNEALEMKLIDEVI